MSARRTPTPLDLPSPGVVFPPGFMSRLEHLAARRLIARDQREGAGAGRVAGEGEEFVGYRPYRPGEDLRRLDWNLLARLDRPFVRVTRREAGGRWHVALDASASMGIGPPGKLQRAAEVAAGIAALGLAAGARVRVTPWREAPAASDAPRESDDANPHGTTRPFDVLKRGDLVHLLAFLERLRAQGRTAARALATLARADISRLFVVGDLSASEPAEVLALSSACRELHVIQILAPVELAPPASGPVEWIDPESGERLALDVDAQRATSYERELARELERWRTACAARRVAFGCFTSALEFEEILRRSPRA